VHRLIEQGVSVNARDTRGFSALHLSVGGWPSIGQTGHPNLHVSTAGGSRVEIVSTLLKHGAEVNLVVGESKSFYTGAEGDTPLVWATQLDRVDIMRQLLAAGADPKGRAAKEHPSEPPLVAAAQNGSLEAMKVLLDAGAPADHGRPLYRLYDRGMRRDFVEPSPEVRTAQVKLLLDFGADPDLSDLGSYSPLSQSISRGNVDAVRLLLNAKARVDRADIYSGTTPLMVAVRSQEIAMVKLLLEFGADRHLKDKKGQTARSIAESLGLMEIAKLLGDDDGS
nr:ankyrin repeat domain-containing protein [Armatimonadota bacterium]